ncbi:MAG TPA: cell envelope integrity EipB family protein [Xanthobacteraceae bacterium]|jgi:hypothetical protein|nr:cell envelope integrity EipB family protein [Xanthobacteraceae bacterium]
MARSNHLTWAGGLLAVPLAVAVLSTAAFPATDSESVPLISHRAIYDLKLANGHNKRSLEAVRGRIVYDFSGNNCEGYALQFRQVTELDTGEGKVATSDLRSVTWEDSAAKSFRFNSQNFLNQKPVDNVDGMANRRGEGTEVDLKQPQRKRLELGNVVFPTEHMRRILDAGRAGKSLLELAVYDGSETGEKVYQSLTVIGRKIEPNENKPTDAAANQPTLAGLARWPVTVSYFDKASNTGEQTPAYSISFELYENGISRALLLDYGDFSVAGQMTSLDIKDAKPCQ